MALTPQPLAQGGYCTECGYDPRHEERTGKRPTCKGTCAWRPYNAVPEGEPEWAFGQPIRWGEQEGIVLQQFVPGGAVLIAVGAKPYFALSSELLALS